MKSYSIHIGVNNVDPVHYQGWDGTLLCCENDALFYESIARKSTFTEVSHLLSSDEAHLPTSENLSSFLKQKSESLESGDLLFMSYSGHGGSIPDENGDEDDMTDETWCLYDRQFLDDELYEHFRQFKAGVKIIVVSDSCHSGTVTKNIPPDEQRMLEAEMQCAYKYMNLRSREAPRFFSYSAYQKNREVYINAAKKSIVHPEEIKAAVLLMSACQDNEKAAEWIDYGLFTNAIKKTIEENKSFQDYEDLFQKISIGMPPIQHPNLSIFGNDAESIKKEKTFLL